MADINKREREKERERERERVSVCVCPPICFLHNFYLFIYFHFCGAERVLVKPSGLPKKRINVCLSLITVTLSMCY